MTTEEQIHLAKSCAGKAYTMLGLALAMEPSEAREVRVLAARHDLMQGYKELI